MQNLARKTEFLLKRVAASFPVVALTGPRQSGKTTLARETFADRPYLSMEDPDVREAVITDPRGFLQDLPEEGAVLDEIQRVPELFSWLQGEVDRNRRRGRFVLTGSHQFLLDERISQSLAGRAGFVRLLPMSISEVRGQPVAESSTDELLLRGFYPDPLLHGAEASLWYGSYVQSYVERDVRQLLAVRDLGTFQRFIRLCAGRTGSLLDIGGLANETGVEYRTAREWLSVLEASYVLTLLRPYHRNFNKRLVKTPKLYFLDPGLAAWLLGIREPEQMVTHPLRGHLFETLVLSEILKAQSALGEVGGCSFWRDRQGHEVDVLVERGAGVQAIEVKSGRTVTQDAFRGLDTWRKLAKGVPGDTLLLFDGKPQVSKQQGHHLLNWREAGDLLMSSGSGG